MAIKVNGTTVIDDSRNLVNIVSGAGSSTDVNAVGTYGAFRNSTVGNFYPGNTFSGSDLAWTNFYGGGSTYNGITPAGTWRIMGFAQNFSTGTQSTIYVRIS